MVVLSVSDWIYVSVCIREREKEIKGREEIDVKERVDRGRENRREERWCWLHQEEAGSDASPCSCSQTPTLFLLECLYVCLSVSIDLVSYYYIRKEESVLFQRKKVYYPDFLLA